MSDVPASAAADGAPTPGGSSPQGDGAHLRVSRPRPHVCLLTLDRPDARNAYSQRMIDALLASLRDAEDDPTIRCVVITGAGRAFSAGGDLKLMQQRAGMFAGDAVALAQRYRRTIQRIPKALEDFNKPIIAAINGAAIGAGLDLACMCDIRVASSRARFGETFVKVGLVPGDGGAWVLSRAVGFAHAIELALTGDVIDARRALQIGLVTHVVEPDALLDHALDIAQRIAANAPLAVQLTRRAFHQAHRQSLTQALETAASYQGMAQRTSDHLEGVAAILEKRSPEFKGE